MAFVYAGQWVPTLNHPCPPFQNGDEIYLKCYISGDEGYLGFYEDYTLSSTTSIQMQGNSRVEKKAENSIYFATWVNKTERNTNAMTFIDHNQGWKNLPDKSKEGRSEPSGMLLFSLLPLVCFANAAVIEKVAYLQLLKPHELVCVPLADDTQYYKTDDMNLAYAKFTTGGQMGLLVKQEKRHCLRRSAVMVGGILILVEQVNSASLCQRRL